MRFQLSLLCLFSGARVAVTVSVYQCKDMEGNVRKCEICNAWVVVSVLLTLM